MTYWLCTKCGRSEGFGSEDPDYMPELRVCPECSAKPKEPDPDPYVSIFGFKMRQSELDDIDDREF